MMTHSLSPRVQAVLARLRDAGNSDHELSVLIDAMQANPALLRFLELATDPAFAARVDSKVPDLSAVRELKAAGDATLRNAAARLSG